MNAKYDNEVTGNGPGFARQTEAFLNLENAGSSPWM